MNFQSAPLDILPHMPPTPPDTPPRLQRTDPDPADIIATFADVNDNLRAPVSDAAIALRPRRTWGCFDVALVPANHAPLAGLLHSDLPEVREQARRREVFVFAVSRATDAGLVAAMTLPRPTQPWATLQHGSHRWYAHDARPLHEFGIDFDVACELRLFGMYGLILSLAPIVARPRPALALPVLHARHAEIAATATTPLVIGDTDVATWPRFLEKGFNIARSIFANGGVERVAPQACDRRVAELALEAWPQEP